MGKSGTCEIILFGGLFRTDLEEKGGFGSYCLVPLGASAGASRDWACAAFLPIPRLHSLV